MGEAISAIVLAGGRARRLGGANEALLEVGGRRIIDRVIESLEAVAGQIILVGHLAEDLDLPGVAMLADDYPAAGTLAALHKGMAFSTNDLCLAVGCDMPFLSVPLLERIATLSEGHDLAVPRIGPHLEALHAAYRKSCLPTIEDALGRRQLKIIDFYSSVRTREVPESVLREIDPDLRSFLNVNTPEDLELARTLAADSQSIAQGG
jgi:molybdopterin-guanine dinucleotide biosynthesis protein A